MKEFQSLYQFTVCGLSGMSLLKCVAECVEFPAFLTAELCYIHTRNANVALRLKSGHSKPLF